MTTYADPDSRARALAAFHREIAEKQKTYRARALAMFPHVCGRCGREFSGKRLRELTVHHKDMNHENNPADGSNWELLCLYCHDDQHGIAGNKASDGAPMPLGGRATAPLANPFAGLDARIGLPGRGEPAPPVPEVSGRNG